MKQTIERIPLAEITYERFVSAYLLPEKPVIITGIESGDTEKITPERIHATFGKEGKRSIGWYDASLSMATDMIPPLVQQVLEREDMSVRPLPMRLFMQPVGHKTLYHYDGNSLHGFNLQVKGRKKWILVSPYTPLASAPMLFVSLVGEDFEPEERIHDFYEFETEEGEMLFLPRYWIHAVETLAEENINYNWVCTPTFPKLDSPSGRRESELLYLRKKIPFVNRFLVDDYASYGGRGEEIVKRYIASLGRMDLIRRIGKELRNLPRTLLLAKEIKAMARKFEKNNFNL